MCLHDRTERFIRDELPRLNTLAENGRLRPVEFVNIIKPMVDDIRLTIQPASLGKQDASRTLKHLGFLVGSTERHLQMVAHEPQGSTWKFMPEAESYIAAIGAVIGLPPILSVYGYWLEDRGDNMLTFTGDPGEANFKSCVQVWNACTKGASDRLRLIGRNDIDIDSDEAVTAIRTAARCYEVVGRKYEEMRDHPSEGRLGLQPATFQRFRIYLCGYPVLGRSYTSANASNLRTNFSADLLSGVCDESYFNRINERLEYLSPEDREIVIRDMATPSVVDRMLDRMCYSKAELITASTDDVANRIEIQSATFYRGLVEFDRLIGAVVPLSNKHFGSIRGMEKGFRSMSPEDKALYPVSPDESVSGAGIERPESIWRMRKDNPVVKKLLAAFALVQRRRGPGC